MLTKDRGVVIAAEDWGEADRRVTLLLNDRGKTYAAAKGARKPNGKLREATELFVLGEFVLYDGGGFVSVTQADAEAQFFALRTDYERFRAACLCAELIERTHMDANTAADALRLLIIALKALEKGAAPAALVETAFQFRYMKLEGFGPVLDGCSVCGGTGAAGRFGGSGLVCEACAARERSVPFSEDARDALDDILNERLPRRAAPPDAVKLLARAAALFRDANMGIELKSAHT